MVIGEIRIIPHSFLPAGRQARPECSGLSTSRRPRYFLQLKMLLDFLKKLNRSGLLLSHFLNKLNFSIYIVAFFMDSVRQICYNGK